MQAIDPRMDTAHPHAGDGGGIVGAEPPTDSKLPTIRITVTVLLALAAALARTPDGRSALPLWLELAGQGPAWFLMLLHLIQGGRRLELGFYFAVAGGGIAVAHQWNAPPLAGLVLTAYVTGSVLMAYLRYVGARLERAVEAPATMLGVLLPAWCGMVILSAVLLALPVSTQSGVPDYRHNAMSHVLDSAFAAVSASTLTGITIQSFGEDYTLFGKAVLVAVTQLSGMAFAAVGLAVIRPFLWRKIRYATVIMAAIVIQFAAVAIMAPAWHPEDAPDTASRIGWSVAYAGSAIWNSGLSLRFDGLATYFADYRIAVVITSLAIIGSLGLPILMELILPQPSVGAGETNADSNGQIGRRLRKLPEFEAVTATVLLALGAILLWYLDHPRGILSAWAPPRSLEVAETRVPLGDVPSAQRWAMSLLVSATARSAGLQSIPVSTGALSWCSLGVLLTWMLIGGSVAGVGGGMRTGAGTLFVVARGLGADERGRRLKSAFTGRLLKFVLFWIGCNFAAFALLKLTTDATVYEAVTESVAAINNVGVSTGLALHLTPAGRFAMIAIFIAGRFVPVWFWLQVADAARGATLLAPTTSHGGGES